MYKGVFPNI
uniref:Uncharacterized protein n=1 Tax=Anguilla anguilla TaxID=7936 RepID=A0A0E9UWM5_ANGAN